MLITLLIGITAGVLSGVGLERYVLGDTVDASQGELVFDDDVDGRSVDGVSDSDGSGCSEGIWVEIRGEVKKPGVYCVGEDWILSMLIEEAGGIKKQACVDWMDREINLASLLTPNSKQYIPGKDDPECDLAEKGSKEGEVENILSEKAKSGVLAVGEGYCLDGKIDLNSASGSVLTEISGVGPATAEKIIEGRPYSEIEDLLDVSGIGPATLEKIRNQVCL